MSQLELALGYIDREVHELRRPTRSSWARLVVGKAMIIRSFLSKRQSSNAMQVRNGDRGEIPLEWTRRITNCGPGG